MKNVLFSFETNTRGADVRGPWVLEAKCDSIPGVLDQRSKSLLAPFRFGTFFLVVVLAQENSSANQLLR